MRNFHFFAEHVTFSMYKKFMTQRKVLVAYYSRTNTTKQLAEWIHEQVGGDLVEITPEVPYSQWYLVAVAAASKERIMKTLRPITTHIDNIDQYDTIFLGTPIWCFTAAPPVKTFTANHELNNKRVCMFCVFGGSGIGSAVTELQALSPQAIFQEPFGCATKDLEQNQAAVKEWAVNSLRRNE